MTPSFINHLWQSTVFAVGAALITLAFRKNRAQVRYWLWLSASLKFLVPFALLIALGGNLWSVFVPQDAPTKYVAPSVAIAVNQIAQPFRDISSVAPSVPQGTNWASIAIFAVWVCGCAAIALMRLRGWLRVRAAIRASKPIDITSTLAIRASTELLEPGVVGFFRPILLVPDGILETLSPRQLAAVVAHELAHVRRHDNLTAAIHMAVEAIFWFYPPVWWIGARLVEERERACDEAVLSLGNEPRDYAEAILNVCKLYVESPLVCVAGVTGADLKKRIQMILTEHVSRDLGFAKKILLVAAGIMSLALPVLVGITAALFPLKAQEAPTFEVASVKPHKPGDRPFENFSSGGRFTEAGEPLQIVIAVAYNLPFQSSQLSGGPDWIRSGDDTYDIEAEAEAGAVQGLSTAARNAKIRLMLQALLADRFKLVIRRETKEQPVYVLTVAKNGPKLQKSKTDPKDCNDTTTPCHVGGTGQGRGIHVKAFSMADLVFAISSFTDRPLIDQTRLTGLYDIDTSGWVPMRQGLPPVSAQPASAASTAEAAAMADPSRPTLFMIFDELGLKMVPSKAMEESFVIEHVERPSEN